MPALSPTMTEGNIAKWNVNEGDTFSAGDVLLEIETDKATMDVEAQEDGVVFKIMAQSGAKAVQVGTRIAVVAEPGDDLATLEVPADEQAQQQQQQSSAPAAAAKDASAQAEGPKGDGDAAAPRASSGDAYVHKKPLLPSTEHLVKQKGLSDEDVSKIKPTGPNGRLLKGDVLAYLGSINAATPGAVSERFEKLAHLDLSNIKVAVGKAEAQPTKPEAEPAAAAEPEPEDLEISVPVSLAKVVEVQRKIQDTLGVFLPLSTFISRASEVANDGLPLPARPPTASELFDQVLGLDKVKVAKGSRGFYLPQISAVPPPSAFPDIAPSRKADIIDILAAPAKKPSTRSAEPSVLALPGLSSGANVFSLVVPREEEERAFEFLERCKVILEEEPGRLVL
jgi:hypothetical protein